MSPILRKIKEAPPEIFHNRFLLLFIILLMWLFLELLELVLPARVLSVFPGSPREAFLFCFLCGAIAYFFLLYLVQRRKLRHKRLSEHLSLEEFSEYPSVDIMVPAHNEESVIQETLDSLLQIDYPNYQVWILDDRSADQTSAKVQAFLEEQEQYREKVKLITRQAGQVPGKAAALNEALEQSSAQYILVCDADARLSKGCLRLALPYFLENEQVGGLQFQKKFSNARKNVLTLCQDFEMAFDTYMQSARDTMGGFIELRGSGQITSRECLLDVGGWDERTLTDDLELSTRMQLKGWRIRFVPEIAVQEEAVITLRALLKQRRRWIEGSVRRYLDHLGTIISFRSKLSWIQTMDLFPFFLQFSVPLWVFLDFTMQLYYLLTGQATYISLLLTMSVLSNILFGFNIVIGIRYWRPQHPWWESIYYGFVTLAYGVLLWPMLVLLTMRKIVFGRKPYQWVKTPRMAD